ncbi:MAG: (deoxy)nucleoside triphosphate pyrophosphohydrolase [Mongoliitalea sp.]
MSYVIPVTCGIIIWDARVLCVQRSESMHLPLKWEFPGGKVEEGEDHRACLQREIQEELHLRITIVGALTPVDFQYNDKPPIRLIPFIATCLQPQVKLQEHRDLVWLAPERLLELDWAAADLPIVEEFMNWWKAHSQQI